MSVYDTYQVVIGLEIHAQLNTKSKAYSSDSTEFGNKPNTQLSPVTLGLPGSLPMINEAVIEKAIMMGLATNCTINKWNGYARKNYFYADLPKGYQITQDKTPICTGGFIDIELDELKKTIGITRIHMEEDAGKSMHDIDPYNTLVDLNRAGVPLIEIVSEPDIRSADEAYTYIAEIRKMLRYLEICDGNMEEGSMRVDANISVMPKGSDQFGERAEIKNMNSLRNVKRAIEHEFTRQIDLIEAGGKVEQQTRSFNAVDGSTALMRTKENAHDYRYFPEPDLQPVILTDEQISSIKEGLPELPSVLKEKYINELSLSEYDASILVEDKKLSTYFEEVITKTHNFKAAANWINGPIRSRLNELSIEIDELELPSDRIVELIHLVDEGTINFSSGSQKIFPELLENPQKTALEVAESLDLIQNSDSSEIEPIVDRILLQFPEKVETYKSGQKGLLGFFMGQVMKESGGSVDPKVANELLRKKLES